MDLYGEFLGLIDALADAGLDYALCGGIAAAIHGYPRFTKDINLLVREEDLDQILDTVRMLGFKLPAFAMRFDQGKPQEQRVRRVSKVQGEELLTLDLVLVGPFLEEAWSGRELFEWKGRHVQVVSAEGLAQMKRAAGRDQDLLDLKKLGWGADEDEEDS